MPFSLDNPKGLFLLAALLPLVALYVLKVRRQRRVVPSTFLWAEAQRDLLAEHPWRRLLPEVPLLLEALALVLFALALAGPSRSGGVERAEHVAFVIDTSASLGARDGTQTRFALAQAAAGDAIRRLAPGAEALVIEAAAEARAGSGLERDRRRLRAVVDALSVREEKGNLEGAVALAASRLGKLPGRRRIVVITDANGDVPEPSEVPLDVLRVGALADNAGIARLEVRRRRDDATGREQVVALALVQNFGKKAGGRFVSLKRRGSDAALASRRIELSPGERTPVTLSFEPEPSDPGKGIVVDLSPGDSLATDDRAFALVPPGPRLPVVLVPPHGDPWLRRALAADPDVELFEAEPSSLGTSAVPDGALVVVSGACPAALPAGDVLVLGPPEGPCGELRVGATLTHPTVTSWAFQDDRFRFVSLDELALSSARSLDVPERARLMVAGDAVVAADLGLTGRTGTLVSFRLEDSNWPLQASFVLFLRNVTERARASRSARAGMPQHTGEVLHLFAPGAAEAWLVRGPDGDTPGRTTDGVVLAPPRARAGFYDLTKPSDRTAVATAAVNFESPEESDLQHQPGAGSAGAGPPAPARAALSVSNLSWLLCLGALLVVVVEMLWFARGALRARALPTPSRAVLGVAAALACALAGYAVAAATGLVEERWLRLERPFSAPAGLLSVGLLWLLSSRIGGRWGPVRRASVEAGLSLAALGAALAACEPSLGSAFDRMALVVAVDRSRSMDLVPDAEARLSRELDAAEAGMQKDDRIAVVAFGSDAVLESPLRRRADARPGQHASVARDGTDLAAGIRRALAETPSDAAARVVVVSDGVATRGDTTAAALAAALASVPVDVVPMIQRAVPNVRVDSVRAPIRADAGETVDLRVTTRSTVDTRVLVRVSRDGQEEGRLEQRIHGGEDVLFLRERVSTPGLHRYEVAVSALSPEADSLPTDNVGTAFVEVEGRSRALILEGDEGSALPLRRALEATAFDVDVAGATRAPAAMDELARYDLVVLSDIPAHELSPEQIAELSAYAEKVGGGLLLFGGDRSMGPGGYARTPLEDTSPVSFDLKNERRRARLSEVIAIDYSGSMSAQAGGHTKLELANEAAARSANLLGPIDRLGVAHVDTSVAWTVPLAPVDDPVGVGRKIRATGPGGGGILIDLALDAAYAALDRERVELRHLLLFADGDDSEERNRAPGLVQAARERGITTSVVSLGRGRDAAALEELSRRGKGRFYLIEDATRLPAVFAQETTIAAGNSIQEVAFRPSTGAPSPATRGVDFSEAPPLRGYVVTRAKARAEVALRAPEGDPLLATWPVGVGQSGAFTSDYKARWGAAWTTWSGAARLFAQLGRKLARTTRDPRIEARAEVRAGKLTVSATALAEDGTADSFRRLTAWVTGPSGFSSKVPLEPTGAGSYGATLPLAQPGGYVAAIADDTTTSLVGTACAVLSAGEELEPRGTDRAELERIARLTEGRVRDGLGDAFRDRPRPRRAFRPLLPFLAMTSALSLLGAVAARRLDVPVPAILRARRRRAAGAGDGDETPGNASARVAGEGRRPGLPSARAEGAPVEPPPAAAGPEPKGTTTDILLERRKRRR